MTVEVRHELPGKTDQSEAAVDGKADQSDDAVDDEGLYNHDCREANEMTGKPSCDQDKVTNESMEAAPCDKAEAESFIKKEENITLKDSPTQSLLTRLKTDLPFRRRYMHTLCVCWGFIVLGWMIGLMGPSFPDLRLIVQQDIDTASWLFTTFSIGYLLGSLIAGIIYDKFNKLLLIFVSIMLMAVTTGAVPWCRQFPLMLVVRFIGGLGAGGLDTGGNADIVSIWDEEGRPYMQAVHFCFAFGGILSPLISEPFLAKKECVTDPSLELTTTDLRHVTSTDAYIYAFNKTHLTNITDSPSGNCTVVYGKTYIHFSYLISAVLILSAAIPFLIMFINTQIHKKPHVVKADKSNMERPDKLPIQLKLVLLVLLSSLMLMYCAVEDTYAGFLMTFCIKQLQWEKREGSIATAVYWAAFSFGRFSGIFLIKRFKPIQLLFAYLIFLICAFIGIYVTTILLTPVIWVFIPLAGFFMSIVFPCIFTWTEESILNVTGKISAMFLIAASSGLMLNPLILGYLFDNFSPLSFVYLLFAESIVCLLLFLTILFLVKKFVENIARVNGKRNSEPEAVALRSVSENC